VNDLRAQGDRDLMAQLLAEPAVKQAIARAERDRNRGGARHRLLAGALRLSRDMAPDVAEIIDHCREKLGIETPLETYVYPSPMFNAGAVRPEAGRLFVMLSSSLLEGFEPAELRFVVGHELGHHAFGHHEIPLEHVLIDERSPSPPALVLKVAAWQRYAEISSDRAGLVAAGDLGPAAAALFKLASGLRGGRVEILIDRFLEQAGDLAEEVARMGRGEGRGREDWLASHPFNPIRLQAAQLFARSQVMVEGGVPLAEVEAGVESLMSLMLPSYLEEKSEAAEAMRRLLFAGAVLIASATGGLSEGEIERIEELFGPGALPRSVDVPGLRAELPRRIAAVAADVPPLRRVQLVRDLATIARADGEVDPAERALLVEIADGTGVPRVALEAALAAPVELD
jgi:Zn-dependent protease with chaperone function